MSETLQGIAQVYVAMVGVTVSFTLSVVWPLRLLRWLFV